MGNKLHPYNALPTTVVFDRYSNGSAKDHAMERRATSVCAGNYTSLSPHLLPTEKSKMKSNVNKTSFAPPLHMYTGSKYVVGR